MAPTVDRSHGCWSARKVESTRAGLRYSLAPGESREGESNFCREAVGGRADARGLQHSERVNLKERRTFRWVGKATCPSERTGETVAPRGQSLVVHGTARHLRTIGNPLKSSLPSHVGNGRVAGLTAPGTVRTRGMSPSKEGEMGDPRVKFLRLDRGERYGTPSTTARVSVCDDGAANRSRLKIQSTPLRKVGQVVLHLVLRLR